jgi:hypothetical protein
MVIETHHKQLAAEGLSSFLLLSTPRNIRINGVAKRQSNCQTVWTANID